MKTKDNIILVGDIHGEFRTLGYHIKRLQITNSTLVQLGDFGIGFYKPMYYNFELNKLNTILQEYNNELLVIRGNHDNPEYFNSIRTFGNILLLKDYTILNDNILCIGGAASVDKEYRTKDVDWWENELPIYDERLLAEITGITHILAHENPKFSKELIKDIENEEIRKYCNISTGTMQCVYNILIEKNNITHWYNGHYHRSHEYVYNNTRFISLMIDEFKII